VSAEEPFAQVEEASVSACASAPAEEAACSPEELVAVQ
jgi:hypothetical protein